MWLVGMPLKRILVFGDAFSLCVGHALVALPVVSTKVVSGPLVGAPQVRVTVHMFSDSNELLSTLTLADLLRIDIAVFCCRHNVPTVAGADLSVLRNIECPVVFVSPWKFNMDLIGRLSGTTKGDVEYIGEVAYTEEHAESLDSVVDSVRTILCHPTE